MRRGLLFVIFVFVSLWLFNSQTLFSQGKEVVSSGKNIELPVVLKGARSPETLPDLDPAYCSNGVSDDIYVDPAHVPDGNTHIVWSAITNVGGIPVVHSEWIESIGSAPNNGIRFFPDRVAPQFQGTAIFIQFQFDDGTWDYDYTYIRKSPTTFTLSGGTDLCMGTTGTLTLNGSENNYEYVLYRDGVLAPALPVSGNGQPLNFQVTQPGVYTVQARRSEQPYCIGLMDGAPEIVVNALPQPKASANAPVCEGENIELYGDSDGAAVFSWSGPDGFSSTQLNPVIVGASAVKAGTYVFTVIDGNNCQNSASVDVVVNENPQVSVSNSGPVCENMPVSVSTVVTGGTGPFTYRWEKDGTVLASQTASSIDIPNATMADAGIYEVFVTDVNTCGNVVSATTTLVINQNPVVDEVTNNGPLCAGQSLALSVSASGGTNSYNFAWTGPDGFSSSLQNPVINGAPVSASGNYQVIVTDGNGCGSAASVTTVTVNELPVPVASNDGPVCAGNDIQLSGAPDGMASYAWNGPLGFSNSDQNPLLASATVDMSGNYVLTVVDANGCANSVATPVIVNELPEVSVSNNGPVCEESDVQITALVTGGSAPYSFRWEKDGNPVVGETGPTLSFNNVMVAQAGVYEVFVTDDLNCGNSVAASTTVVVNPKPVIGSILNNAPLCEGATLLLSVTLSDGTPPYNFAWTGPNGFVSNLQNPSLDNVTVAAAGDYNVLVTDANGCISASALTSVVINETPTVSISNNGPVCEGEPVSISASVSGGIPPYSYSWTKNGSVLPGETSSEISFMSANTGDAGVYEVSVSDVNSCVSATASTELKINELPVVVISEDVAICEGNTATFSASATGGDGNYTFSWSFNGSPIVGETGADLLISNTVPAQSGNYMVTVTDNNSCSGSSASATLTVHEKPVVTIVGSPMIEICSGTDRILNASASGGTGSYDFIWELPDGSNVNGKNLTLNNISSSHAGIYQVYLSDGVSCGDTAQVQVVVNSAEAEISISSPSGGADICSGTAVTFNANGGLNYTFYVNGNPVANNVTGTYTTSSLLNGDQVFVHVTDEKGCEDDSEVITMVVTPNPIVSLLITSPNGDHPCMGQPVEFLATAGYVNYIFFVNGTEAQNGSDNIFVPADLNSGDQVTVMAENDKGCTGTSAAQTVTFNPLPVATLVSDQAGNVACPGQPVIFTAGGGNTYEFMIDGISQGAASVDPVFNMNAQATGTSTILVVVTDVNGCSNSAFVDLQVHEAPVVSLDEDRWVCEGSSLSFEASVTGGQEPYSYVWEKNGTLLPGFTSSSLTFPEMAISDAGLYSVTVTDNNACPGLSVTESINVHVNNRPVASVSSNSPVCENTSLVFNASSAGGSGEASFKWFKNGAEIAGQSSDEYVVENALLSDNGTYEVMTIDENTCESLPVSVEVNVNELPLATLTADQINIFQGTQVTFTAGGGTEYTFFLNGAQMQARGVDNEYVNASLVDGDEVSVEVFNAQNCSQTASVIINVYELVPPPVVNTENSIYCEGEGGANVNVENPLIGVVYEIVFADNSSAGYPVLEYDGTAPVRWEGILDQQNPTTYKVAAYRNSLPADIVYSDGYEVKESPLPDVYTMTVDGTVVVDELIVEDCTGGNTYDIGVGPTWGPDTYQLLLNETQVLEEIVGGPVPVVFEDYNLLGTYTIRAVSKGQCSAIMNGSFTIKGDGSEVGFDLTMTPENGQFCEGSDGVEIMLEGSLEGTDYVLFKDGAALNTLPGTGQPISYGLLNEAGTYHVEATSSGGCVYSMNNTLELIANPLPESQTLEVTNGGHYCEGGIGVRVSLDNQVSGVRYELIDAGSLVMVDAVDGVSGEGAFFFKTDAGSDFFTDATSYYVRVLDLTSGCEVLSNEISVVMDVLPNSYAFTGDADYCAEGGMAVLSLESSENDVTYELYLNGVATGNSIPGNGNSLAFVVSQPGDYTVLASSVITGCRVVSQVLSVAEKPLPQADLTVTLLIQGDAGDCSQNALISIESSEDGVEYELVKILSDGSLLYTGNVITGNGNTVQFPDPVVDKGATYGVLATLNGCEKMLNNTVNVNFASVPQLFAITGDGNQCEGEEVHVGLSGSESDVDYELFREGDANVLETIPGTGSAIDFTLSLTQEDSYYVVGVSSLTGCSLRMSGELVLTFNPLPMVAQMTGSGFYCDEVGAVMGLDSSEPGVEYQLIRDDGAAGAIVDSRMGAADGGEITFAPQLLEGDYSVVAHNSTTGCSVSMDGLVNVVKKTVPEKPVTLETDNVYYCSGEDGYNLAVTNAVEGVLYSVYNRANEQVSVAVGTADQTLEVATLLTGAYVVRASWGWDACISENSDSVLVIEAPDPELLTPFSDGETISRSGSTVDYTFADGALQEDVSYWLIKETAPVDTVKFEYEPGDVVVTIPETGSYRLEGYYSQYQCKSVIMNGRLEIFDQEWLSDEDFPNAFSPNGDSFNEYYKISADGLIIDQSRLEVYNRWGTLVYRSGGMTYNNDWDGTSNVSSMISIGDKLPNGVYFYVFSIRASSISENGEENLESKKFNGFIELRR